MRHLVVGLGVALTAVAAAPAALSQERPARAAAAQQPAPQPAPQTNPEINVRASADRTALWVGDRVLYTVQVECAPTVDILADDLAKEKLRLQGLELVDAESERTVGESGRATYTFRYRLTTYETEATALSIADGSVRYGRRRAGQRVEDAAPAGEVKVPGAVLALRSTLPDRLAALDPRDARPLDDVPMLVRLAKTVGIALVIVSAAPVLLWVGSLAHRARPKRRKLDTRGVRNQTRAALEELESADASSEADRRAAYTRLETVIRDHLSGVTGIPARALTPPEIAERLSANSAFSIESLSVVLGECERARYGPLNGMPPSDRFREAVGTAGRALAVSR